MFIREAKYNEFVVICLRRSDVEFSIICTISE